MTVVLLIGLAVLAVVWFRLQFEGLRVARTAPPSEAAWIRRRCWAGIGVGIAVGVIALGGAVGGSSGASLVLVGLVATVGGAGCFLVALLRVLSEQRLAVTASTRTEGSASIQ